MIAHVPEIRPLTTAIGAEIFGVDISRPLDDKTYALIRKTYVERGVVFFRDQDITPEQFVEFAKRFGPLMTSDLAVALVEGRDEIEAMAKKPGAPANIGGVWHTDQSFQHVPVMGTILVARLLPEIGGDTLWVSASAAFEALSEGFKTYLRGLRAVHTNEFRPQQIKKRAEVNAGKPPDEWILPEEAVHPVVGRHPETGREVLYVNETYTVRFEGWTMAESEPLLKFLFAHVQRPEFGCRFHWEPGSVAFWDNRQCLHYAVNDYPGGTRMMHRLMVEGPFLTS